MWSSPRLHLVSPGSCSPSTAQPLHTTRGRSGAQHSPLWAANRRREQVGLGDFTFPRESLNILLSLLMGSMTPVLRIGQGTIRHGEMGGGVPRSPEASPSPHATACHPDSVRLLGSLRGVCVWVSGFSVSVSCAQIKAALLETAVGRVPRLPQDSQPYVSAPDLSFPGQETEVQEAAVAAPSQDLDPSRATLHVNLSQQPLHSPSPLETEGAVA